jgi:hypothetical protein
MPGKRLARAHHGPEEDRAHRLSEDRARRMRFKGGEGMGYEPIDRRKGWFGK